MSNERPTDSARRFRELVQVALGLTGRDRIIIDTSDQYTDQDQARTRLIRIPGPSGQAASEPPANPPQPGTVSSPATQPPAPPQRAPQAAALEVPQASPGLVAVNTTEGPRAGPEGSGVDFGDLGMAVGQRSVTEVSTDAPGADTSVDSKAEEFWEGLAEAAQGQGDAENQPR